MAEHTEAEPVYLHNCVALGKDTVTPRALKVDSAGEYVLFYQHKCPFCMYTAPGTKEYATGVRPDTLGGYYVDTKIAEKLR